MGINFLDFKIWFPVTMSLLLIFSHTAFSTLCPFLSGDARNVCIISSQALINLAQSGQSIDSQLEGAGVLP